MSDEEVGLSPALARIREQFPVSWKRLEAICNASEADAAVSSGVFGEPVAVPCEITRLRAENDALRVEVGGLRLRIAAMELSYRAALADARPARVVAPLHRALAVRPGAFGLHTGLEG